MMWYVYFIDGGKTLHFTSDKNKGSLSETMKGGEPCFWAKDRYDLFQKETRTNNKGKEISTAKIDNVTKIVIEKKIIPLSCYSLFSFPNLVIIEKIKNLDTSNVSDFSQMFLGCAMKEIDMSTFNWNNCEDVNSMFAACGFLEKVKLGNLKGTKLKNISGMFWWCKKIKEVDFSNWNIDGLVNARECFLDCESLEKVIFPKNQPKLKAIDCMFKGCKNINSIDLSNFLYNND